MLSFLHYTPSVDQIFLNLLYQSIVLTYNIVLISTAQQSDSVVHTYVLMYMYIHMYAHVYTLFFIFFIMVYLRI